MYIKKLLFSLLIIYHFSLLNGQENFSFVFLPDTHLNSDSLVKSNFNIIASKINNLKPDFVIAGGDMLSSALMVNEQKAKVLYDFMITQYNKLKCPVYYVIGNREVVGIFTNSGINSSNSLWGKGMYESIFGKTYKSFMHSNWKFFLLDGIIVKEEQKKYVPGVDSLQMEWIKKELLLTNKDTPIIVVIHTPLVNPKNLLRSSEPPVSKNSIEVLNLFSGYNLKMVLQGHTHVYMNLLINGIYFISGGSTSNNLDLNPINFGFIQVVVKKNIPNAIFIKF